jgi:hypothetical protein
VKTLALAVLVAASVGLGTASAAGDTLTIHAASNVVRAYASVGLSGAVAPAATGEQVTVQGKECHVPGPFYALGSATTVEGDSWSTSIQLQAKTTLRAEWKGEVSATVIVRPRAYVALMPRGGGRFDLNVQTPVADVNGKSVVIEHLTGTGWRRVRTVVVRSSFGVGGADRNGLRFDVPKGTTLRAVVPLSEVKPCYLAGYSKLVRT